MANNVNVTSRGFEYICQWANGANPGSTAWPQPKAIGWGTANGSNATTVNNPASAPAAFPPGPSTAGTGQFTDVAPFFESAEARVSGTASVTGNTVGSSFSTYQVLATITSLSNQSIGESFIAMSTTKPAMSSVATGSMTNVQTNLTTATALGIAAPYYIQIDNEVLYVSSTAASNVLNVVRGNLNTTNTSNVAHALNAGVTLGNPVGTPNTNPNNGDLFAHAGFVALALNTNDSIAFTWQVNVTS